MAWAPVGVVTAIMRDFADDFTRLARKYALGEDHDDFRQRVYVRLVESGKTFGPETPFAFFVEAEMRHMRARTSRSHRWS